MEMKVARGTGDKLARCAVHAENSLGRRHPETEHPYRSAYGRDRDRIIHSRAFRRLENKTQVFTRRYSDHFRTRLTHTLEVAQISRTVARALNLNRDLVEALALAHDIGHPPFGHAGEHTLNRLMERHGGSFEHNLHALRIVEQFEQKYIRFPGLNLTFEVREGIVKHSRQYSAGLNPDLCEYLLELQPPLEAQLIDPADEIAYNCADLDDGYESRLLKLATIRDKVPLFDRLYRPIETAHPQSPEKLRFNETLRRLVDVLVTDLIVTTRERVQRLKIRSVGGVRRLERRQVGLSPRVSKENQRLKEFLQAHLYSHPEVRAERGRIVRHMERLFAHYLSHPRSLPEFYFTQIGQECAPRVVCDYIAGMTDNFLEQQAARILRD
jgi:dGTPase